MKHPSLLSELRMCLMTDDDSTGLTWTDRPAKFPNNKPEAAATNIRRSYQHISTNNAHFYFSDSFQPTITIGANSS